MGSGAAKLKDFYQRELHHLREEAVQFAHDHPAVAQELALSRGKSADPHVELLLQSFAFLAGRLRYQLEAEQSMLPNALLEQLYPHLEAPVPAMAIAQVEVKPDGANFANGWTLARHRSVHAVATEAGRQIKCRFRSVWDADVWPLAASEAAIIAPSRFEFLRDVTDVLSVLRVKVHALGNEPIQDLPLHRLRFHINGDDLTAYELYSLLAANLVGMAVRVREDEAPRRLKPAALQWVGFEEQEAALPTRTATHPGYRLLQEYFAYPEKFMFFDITGLDLSGAIEQFELFFLLDTVPRDAGKLRPDTLKLNCVPFINLFTQSIDPLRLDHRSHEYRLTADVANHRHCEIYGIEELAATTPDSPPRPVVPYFSMERHDRISKLDYFFATRRAESHLKSVPGTELYVSFLDLAFDATRPPEETIGGRALCTNRRLPERLRAGDRLMLDGPGPVKSVRLLSKPSVYHAPALLGARPWALVSQLSLNQLSLEGAVGQSAFKAMLRVHAGTGQAASLKQIESLAAIDCKPVLRNIRQEPWRGFCRGLAIRLLVDEEWFEGGSPVLFAEVLRRFFALYAHINTFAEVSLESRQRKGVWKQWPPLAGAQAIL